LRATYGVAVTSAPKQALLFTLVGIVSAVSVTAILNRQPRPAAALEASDPERAATAAEEERDASLHATFFERPVEHFRILYQGGAQAAIGERVARVLEREYSRIGKTLNSYPSEPVTVILYTNREFQDITRSPSWATGRYDGRIRVAVGGAIDAANLDRIVTHELVHAVVASAAPRGVPAWLNEGLASYLESNDVSWAPAVIRNATTLLPLEDLIGGFSGLDEQNALVAYAESAIAAEILCDQLGANVGRFLQMVGNGSAVDEALLEFHLQPNAFQSEWRRRVGAR
jgi:hypothetical protein